LLISRNTNGGSDGEKMMHLTNRQIDAVMPGQTTSGGNIVGDGAAAGLRG
jgi:hypothetical protein